MTPVVTVLAGPDRPAYLGQTLAALADCDGRAKWPVIVVADRPTPDVKALLAGWPNVVLSLDNAERPAYGRASEATRAALSLGFAHGDFVAHLEEDVVPHRDYLTWMHAQATRYQDNPDVLAVCPWGGPPSKQGVADPDAARLVSGFTPWGWGTWADRWQEIGGDWSDDFWDRHLNEVVRGDRLVVHPLVNRVTDIGALGGVNPSAEWAARQ